MRAREGSRPDVRGSAAFHPEFHWYGFFGSGRADPFFACQINVFAL